MTHCDFIIVGQGLAGTTLAWTLCRRGRSVVVLDRETATTASRIAAGLVTPVTGRRLARSGHWDKLYPIAERFYRDVEDATGSVLWHATGALRLFADADERAEFRRRTRPDAPPAVWIGDLARPTEAIPPAFEAPHGGFVMPAAARLDVPRYLDVSRQWLGQRDAYRRADLDWHRDLELSPDRVRLPRLGLTAAGLIACRGFTIDPDPWFGGVRFIPAHGEVLTVHIPDLEEQRTIHRGVWLAAIGHQTYRCGATYSWERLDGVPSPAGRAELETRLRAFLRLPFRVVGHQAAVRPVIDAGTPSLGRHPRYPQLAFFNGLGSKGVLLAPYYASVLADCLLAGHDPEPGVNVHRYLSRPCTDG